MRTIVINVTQEDIDEGLPDKCSQCPVALAVKRYVRPRYYIMVSAQHLTVYPPGPALDQCLYPMPDSVSNFVQNFDDAQRVKPFEFELEVEADNEWFYHVT